MKIYLTYRERVAGFFILITISLVSLFVVGAAVENLWFTPKVEYHVYVVHGDGLRKGSPVLLSGVDAGRIGELTILKDGRVDVTLSVLKQHAGRVTTATRAQIRRALGIGEKRVLLVLPTGAPRNAPALKPGRSIPVDEPRDLLDVVSNLDLGKYMATMERTVQSLDLLLAKLEEEDRLARMVEAFDKLGPTLDVMNDFFTDIHQPFKNVISDPAIPAAFAGGAKLFNDKQTTKLVHTLARSIDKEQVASLMAKSDQLIDHLNRVLVETDGHLSGTLSGADKLLNNQKLDKMISSMAKISDDKKVEKLLANMTVLSTQMAKVGPEIPRMTKQMNKTMHELLIVLKALQRTWLLDDETEDVLKKLKKQKQ